MAVANLQATYWPGGRVPSDGHLALWTTGDPSELAQAIAQLGLPHGHSAQLPTVGPASARARRRVTPSTWQPSWSRSVPPDAPSRGCRPRMPGPGGSDQATR